MAASTITVTANQGETLDALAWRATSGRPPALEEILALNPGLAARGEILEELQLVVLPVAPAARRLETVNIWN